MGGWLYYKYKESNARNEIQLNTKFSVKFLV